MSEGLVDRGLCFGNPDFLAYARSFAVGGHRVGAADEPVPLLDHCQTSGGVHLVDVAIDYSENQRVLGDVLANRAELL